MSKKEENIDKQNQKKEQISKPFKFRNHEVPINKEQNIVNFEKPKREVPNTTDSVQVNKKTGGNSNNE